MIFFCYKNCQNGPRSTLFLSKISEKTYEPKWIDLDANDHTSRVMKSLYGSSESD